MCIKTPESPIWDAKRRERDELRPVLLSKINKTGPGCPSTTSVDRDWVCSLLDDETGPSMFQRTCYLLAEVLGELAQPLLM